MLSKSHVNKIGREIRKSLNDELTPKTNLIDTLQEYRTSFKPDVARVFSQLQEISTKVRSDSIVSFRIKRIESILSKIKREPTLPSQIWVMWQVADVS